MKASKIIGVAAAGPVVIALTAVLFATVAPTVVVDHVLRTLVRVIRR